MSSADINRKIKEFVRDKMGCKCPDEVFEHVEVEKDLKLGYFDINYKINVGNRLLIYVVDGEKCNSEEIQNIVNKGVKERDERNFNRFRLVLIMDEMNEEKCQKLIEIVEKIEKAHIHFVKKSDVSVL